MCATSAHGLPVSSVVAGVAVWFSFVCHGKSLTLAFIFMLFACDEIVLPAFNLSLSYILP